MSLHGVTFQKTPVFAVDVCFHSLTWESVKESRLSTAAPYRNWTLKITSHLRNDVRVLDIVDLIKIFLLIFYVER